MTGSKIKTVLRVILVTLLAVIAAGAVFVAYCVVRAPSINVLDAKPHGYRSNVLDRDGNVVLTLSGEASNRVYVKLSEVPESLQEAVVAIEDERFYEHFGIDPKGIMRALYKGITEGNFSEGASTITQQLLKNNVFTDWMNETTFLDKVQRKIQEQYLAIALEMHVDKAWILENYLNTINLGGGNWGVETAAKYYFDKDVSDLTLSESAVIAGITRNPTRYNPITNPEANAERRDYILDKMLELGFITQEERDEAAGDDVYARISEVSTNGGSQEIMTYFEDAMIYSVLHDIMSATRCSEEKAWDLIYRGGLTICSTEDSRMQELAGEVINNPDYYTSDEQASLVLMDTETGQVRALIGGRGEKNANLLLNRATSMVRQPGSTIKVIGEYAAALDSGAMTLGTVIADSPCTYSDGTEVHNFDGAYKGNITVQTAIAQSRNIVALKCFNQIGMDPIWNMIGKFGITTLTENDKVEALALGGTYGGVTNLEMTAAYASIARGGQYTEPILYTKILDHDGNVLIEKKQTTRRVISENTAKLLTSALEDAMLSGTGVEANFESDAVIDLAGKSGTTTDIRDAWFIGYSPSLTCGVWGGFDDNRTQESSTYVKYIWKDVMAGAHTEGVAEEFETGTNIEEVEICTKCGKRAVKGLCENAIHGDGTETVCFASGTAPTEKCDCHVMVAICAESGELSGPYCKHEEGRVYLKSAVPGTEEEQYVLPASLSDPKVTCHTHTSLWDKWFGSGSNNNGNGSNNGGTGGNGTGSRRGTGGTNGTGGTTGNNGTNGSGTGRNSSGSDTGRNSSGSDTGDSWIDWWNDFWGI